MVYVGLWMSQHIFHRFTANIGTYNLTSFLKFQCPHSILNIMPYMQTHTQQHSRKRKKKRKFLRKSMDRSKSGDLVSFTPCNWNRVREKAYRHFHSHQLILSYLRTFDPQFTYCYTEDVLSGFFGQPFSICQFSVWIAFSCRKHISFQPPTKQRPLLLCHSTIFAAICCQCYCWYFYFVSFTLPLNHSTFLVPGIQFDSS